jgi:hypothetical protein
LAVISIACLHAETASLNFFSFVNATAWLAEAIAVMSKLLLVLEIRKHSSKLSMALAISPVFNLEAPS